MILSLKEKKEAEKSAALGCEDAPVKSTFPVIGCNQSLFVKSNTENVTQLYVAGASFCCTYLICLDYMREEREPAPYARGYEGDYINSGIFMSSMIALLLLIKELLICFDVKIIRYNVYNSVSGGLPGREACPKSTPPPFGCIPFPLTLIFVGQEIILSTTPYSMPLGFTESILRGFHV